VNHSSPDYAESVRDGLRRKLRSYAEDVVRHRASKDFTDLIVRVWLVTAHSLKLEHQRIFEQAKLQLSQDLPGASLDQIYYRIDLGTNPPDFSVTIEPPPASKSYGEDLASYPLAQGWLILQVSYQDYEAPFHLAPSASWVPLGRGVTVKPGLIGVRIADRVHAVPRGALLQLRRRGEWLQVRRAEDGPQYTVFFNGRALDYGDVMDVAAQGTITYLGRQGAATQLTYRVLQER
jgi:hypothetical protein